MNDKYSAILEGVIAYERKTQIIVCFFLIVAIITIIAYAIKDFRRTTQVNRVIICTLAIVFFCILILFVGVQKQNILRIESDAKYAEYVIYRGQFTHDNYQKDSFYHNVCILDENGEEIVLRYPDFGDQYNLHQDHGILPTGTFSGTIVYSKTSRIIVDWTLDK